MSTARIRIRAYVVVGSERNNTRRHYRVRSVCKYNIEITSENKKFEKTTITIGGYVVFCLGHSSKTKNNTPPSLKSTRERRTGHSLFHDDVPSHRTLRSCPGAYLTNSITYWNFFFLRFSFVSRFCSFFHRSAARHTKIVSSSTTIKRYDHSKSLCGICRKSQFFLKLKIKANNCIPIGVLLGCMRRDMRPSPTSRGPIALLPLPSAHAYTQQNLVPLSVSNRLPVIKERKNASRAHHTRCRETNVCSNSVLYGLQSVVVVSPTPVQYDSDPIGGGTFYHPTPASRARTMPDVAKLPRTASKKLHPVSSRLTAGNVLFECFWFFALTTSTTPVRGGNTTRRRPRDFQDFAAFVSPTLKLGSVRSIKLTLLLTIGVTWQFS